METVGSSSVGLTKVVLYKHGIGYFERRAIVCGPTKINLVCEANEIDDMLKSLLVLAGSGRIDAVTYDSSKTLESRLAEFGFDISNTEGLSGLLAQMKGIPVTVNASGESVSGRMLGLDSSEQVFNESVIRELYLTLYTAESCFKRIALSSITAIQVNDESMASELKQQLELLFQNAKKKDRKALSVVLTEPGETDILIAYSIPCPIWKTSYRLLMHDDSRVLLQGMAIVDNLQEEDWNEVQIILVSASPISFIQPLYDPVQPFRPTIAAQGNVSSGPILAERADYSSQAMAAAFNAPAAPGAVPSAGGKMKAYAEDLARGAYGGGAFAGQVSQSAGKREASAMLSDEFATQISVEAGTKGELFEYKISKPVSIPRNSSALIPIVQQDIEGERISLYNESKNAKFPHAAIRFVNNTGLTLEGGPVTVMESDIYAGEALLDTTKPDDKRFLLYAIDQSCPVTIRSKNLAKPFWRVRSINGMLYMDYRYCSEKTYAIENLSDRKKVVFVEHPFRNGWVIVGKAKAVETTQNFYRFRLEIEPKSAETLVVSEESDNAEVIRLGDFNGIDPSRLNMICSQNFMSKEFVEFLKTMVEKRDEIQSISAEQANLQQLLRQYTEDQARARENLKTLGANNERYRKIIDSTEDQITEINKKLYSLNLDLAVKMKEYQNLALKQFVSEMENPKL